MFVAYVLSKIRANQRYRKTVRELSQYSDEQLTDVGISRFEINAIALRQYSQ
ncbi:DUF1127 domain-containing protein [Pararhizobium sp. BT-229]|uniref:DUF1127 domain-containing protein n=1 Tax=Pararhizobium sp. BT-229 TaxID=2986923 RepID=UPI0021F69E8D|nr:DUF1127 domain-containing protein [Pararhizobium sp. BT-229]MCV9960301.1 DUF1127 domain-containing protein [Pararhizobium sp. BT-229]